MQKRHVLQILPKTIKTKQNLKALGRDPIFFGIFVFPNVFVFLGKIQRTPCVFWLLPSAGLKIKTNTRFFFPDFDANSSHGVHEMACSYFFSVFFRK